MYIYIHTHTHTYIHTYTYINTLGGFKTACGAPHRRNLIFPLFQKHTKSHKVSEYFYNSLETFLDISEYFRNVLI